VASAQIFVSCHISGFVFAVFANRNSALLEIQAEGQECRTLGEMWANLSQAKYVAALPMQNCRARGDNAYFEQKLQSPVLTDADLKGAIKRAYIRATAAT
jgi:capsular polysaccharide biosynthesis protein